MQTLKKQTNETQWVPISDLMSVLMMIFLFISVIYMRHIQQGKQKIEEIAVTYSKLQTDLYKELSLEFKSDLVKWNATLDSQTLAVRFNEPDVLFSQGESEIKPEFKAILNNFFPRYLKIITSNKFKDDIEELRIEGHTSTEWRANAPKDYSYFMNMKLSQDRTRSVLYYVMLLPDVADQKDWMQKKMTSNGLSSSQPIIVQGEENHRLSRRVEFRVRTNAESKIAKILEITK